MSHLHTNYLLPWFSHPKKIFGTKIPFCFFLKISVLLCSSTGQIALDLHNLRLAQCQPSRLQIFVVVDRSAVCRRVHATNVFSPVTYQLCSLFLNVPLCVCVLCVKSVLSIILYMSQLHSKSS